MAELILSKNLSVAQLSSKRRHASELKRTRHGTELEKLIAMETVLQDAEPTGKVLAN